MTLYFLHKEVNIPFHFFFFHNLQNFPLVRVIFLYILQKVWLSNSVEMVKFCGSVSSLQFNSSTCVMKSASAQTVVIV